MLRGILTLRCPRCRRGRLFSGIIDMPERCPECGLVYEREHGYFVGAMAISYGLAVGLIAILFFAVLAATRWSLEWVLLVAGLAFLPLSPLCFRYARALWMYLDRRIDPIDPDVDRDG
ncbi:MAG TPA: DUF983 domain-containing protein [Candidatus Limnocylindria bacterium]|nr:DUF983 domain-containing protein [Candidatus Limnocylindria bacterium]